MERGKYIRGELFTIRANSLRPNPSTNLAGRLEEEK
jgi:hypothetical protein